MKNLDLENLCDKIKATLIAKFNAKLLEIDAEKADFVLDPVNDNAYMFQSLDDNVTNYNPSIYYGIETSPMKAVNQAIAKNPRIEVSVIVADSQDTKIYRKLWRYQRALEEIFGTDNIFPIIGLKEKVKLSNLEPITFKDQNSTSEFKAIGVIIELDLFS